MKGDIRKARKKTSLTKEFKHKLVIAGLQVMTNDKIPAGVMVVSPAEGERLAELVASATANAKPTDETQKEGE